MKNRIIMIMLALFFVVFTAIPVFAGWVGAQPDVRDARNKRPTNDIPISRPLRPQGLPPQIQPPKGKPDRAGPLPTGMQQVLPPKPGKKVKIPRKSSNPAQASGANTGQRRVKNGKGGDSSVKRERKSNPAVGRVSQSERIVKGSRVSGSSLTGKKNSGTRCYPLNGIKKCFDTF